MIIIVFMFGEGVCKAGEDGMNFCFKEEEIMSKVSIETKYSNRHEWIRAIIAAVIALIVGFFGGQQKTTIDMNEYLKEADSEKVELKKENNDLKSANEDLKNEINNLKKELDASTAVSFPEGYYYPATGVYLLDNFEINNGSGYQSFADSSEHMKGQIYNNGLILSQEGQAVFYLNKDYKMLEFILGPVDNQTTNDIATIKVYADGQQMNKVINQNYDKMCTTYTFNIEDCHELKIQWSHCGWSSYGIADLKLYK